MDSIKLKCKNWIVYFKKFGNFHLIHLIVKKRSTCSTFMQFFAIVVTNCYCCLTHVRDLNTFFKKHASKVVILQRRKNKL